MDPFSIGLMLASAALSQHANNAALKKQQQQAVQAQQRQLQQRNMATDAAMKRVQDFDPGTRQKRQDEITQELTTGYEREVAAPAITAQGTQIGATLPQGEGGTDYLKARAREQAKATESLRALAALMGRTGSAGELRRGEAVGFGDTAGEVSRIQNHAGNLWQADQVGIEAAGQPSLGASLASAALGAYGMNQMVTSGLNGPSIVGAPTGGGVPGGVGINPAAGSGLGLKGGRGLGLKGAWA